ncbi:MAG: exo-alpha-sialidase [Chloroflexi bacterium]|nr:exo-alpha-sialidase [Chloroflexota bacterium]
MKRIGIVILILLGVIPPLTAQGQQPSETTWSSPLFLGTGWWQSVTIDQEGRLHVAWYGGLELDDGLSHDILAYTNRAPDGTWTPLNDVIYTGDGGYTVRNALAVTSDGILHTVFRAVTKHQYSRAPARAADQAGLWQAPLDLNDGGYYIDLTVGEGDVLHLLYSGGLGAISRGQTINYAELSPCAFCNDMFYRRSDDGGRSWSAPYPLSFEAETGSDRMDIFEGQTGNLYAVWDEGYDWYAGRGAALDVRVAYSLDSGLTWSEPIILDGGGFADRKPIQIAGVELMDGSLMVVWRYSTDFDRNIYYQITGDLGETWTQPQPIPGFVTRSILDTPLDDYELVIDRLGNVSLFATGQPNAQARLNAALYHVQYRNGNWLAPQRLFYLREERPEWPKAAVGPDNTLHLTFFTRGLREDARSLSEDTGFRMYYMNLPGRLPSTAQAFRPTETPRPTPTIVQDLPPTTTPFPTEQPITEIVQLTTTDNYASQIVLGGLFAAGLLCAIILAAVRFIGRK